MCSPKPCEGDWAIRWVPDETQDWAIVAHKLALSLTTLLMWYLPYLTFRDYLQNPQKNLFAFFECEITEVSLLFLH